MIMTHDKARKAAIRTRMAEAGEPYSVARHVILSDGPAGAERAGTGGTPPPDATGTPAEDYFARYLREAAEAGVPAEDLEVMAAAHRAQEQLSEARRSARLAEDAAGRAEHAAELAEERAELADEAAGLAAEWASAPEQDRAHKQAERLHELADAARDRAEQAMEAADQATELLELAQERAGDAPEFFEEEDEPRGPGDPRGHGPRPPRRPQPPRPPQSARPHPGRWDWEGTDRLMERLEGLDQHFAKMQDKTAKFLQNLGFGQDPG
jgi:hypothetical protein